MPAPRILPLGFIERTTDNGAIIRLTAPSDSHNLRPETPATLRNPAEEERRQWYKWARRRWWS